MSTASILIVTYNSAAFISECLHSLQKVQEIALAEVLIHDNASTDDTVLRIKSTFSPTQLVESETNLGFAKAVNMLAALAQKDYLVLLNPDTVVEPFWLESLLKTFSAHKRVGAVNSKTKILLDGKEYIQNAGNYLFHDGHSRDRGAVVTADKRQLYETDSSYYQQETEIPAVSGVSLAIPRKLFSQIGGFDEHMFMYYEDTDLSIRLKKLGYHLWYQPRSQLTHLHSASSKEWSEFFVYHTELNRLLLVGKHFPLGTVITETVKYKFSMLAQLLKGKKRFFTRLKVLLAVTANLAYLISYRMKEKK